MQNYLESDEPVWVHSKRDKLLAWSAHLFTATGALWGLLSLLAITNQQWILAFVWMSAAVAVDSLDGFLARRLRVKTVLPGFDGALLDNTVDYLNYVFVPAFFLTQHDLLPPGLSVVGAVLILLASAYQFCQDDAKTEDHYFKGFPSYWNILVFYLFMLEMDPWVNLVVVAVLAVLVFVPIKYIYPSRTTAHQSLTLTLAVLWAAAVIVTLVTYPNHAIWLVWASLLFAGYYVGLSLYQTFATRRH
jgi:phosphatidylcholine synthase